MAVLMLYLVFVLSQALHGQDKAWQTATPLAWGTLTEGWQLALFAEKQSFIAGEHVTVMLVGRNGNPTSLPIRVQKSSWFLADFTIRRLGDGKPVIQRPSKDAADRVRRSGLGARFSQVAPGSTVPLPAVELDRMYDFAPGSYTLYATFLFSNSSKTAWVPVRSNEITVSIIAR